MALKAPISSILELPSRHKTAEGVVSLTWGKSHCTVDKFSRDIAAPVSSNNGTLTLSNSTVHVLNGMGVALTKWME